MTSIKIDDKEYSLENLSEDAKQQLASLQFVQNEIKRLEAQIAVYKTASVAYSKALKENLDQ